MLGFGFWGKESYQKSTICLKAEKRKIWTLPQSTHLWGGQGQAGLSWANPTVWFTEEGSCLHEICNLIFQTIRPTSTFPSRLPDVCQILDLADWPWVFISFLTTTALFEHLRFYASPKWEPQLKKREPNHTESWTIICAVLKRNPLCRSLLCELQSLILSTCRQMNVKCCLSIRIRASEKVVPPAHIRPQENSI